MKNTYLDRNPNKLKPTGGPWLTLQDNNTSDGCIGNQHSKITSIDQQHMSFHSFRGETNPRAPNKFYQRPSMYGNAKRRSHTHTKTLLCVWGENYTHTENNQQKLDMCVCVVWVWAHDMASHTLHFPRKIHLHARPD